ncbi:MAG: hypothetical protein ACYSTL_01120, partial [Planctomycetota bacterium]
MTRCFWVTALLCLVISSSGVVRADDRKVQDESSGVRRRIQLSRLRLRRAGIGALKSEEQDTGLEEAIQSVQNIDIEPEAKMKPPSPVATTQPASRPASQPTQQSEVAPRPQRTEELIEPVRPSRPRINPRILGQLRQISANDVFEPLALADSLYLGGYNDEAYEMYQMVQQREPEP